MGNDSFGLLGLWGLAFVLLYLCSLLFVGWAGKRARKENTLADFFLSGRHLGLFVLFLTLYATQYSGLTLIGFAGGVYRKGFVFLVSITFALAIIGAYFIFAPRLYRLSRERQFLTIGDYLHFRYGSAALTMLTTGIFIVALGNYVLSNLKAIGYLVEMATGGLIAFIPAVIAMSLIMVVYESLGGMRSVAWTDAIQGSILLVGCVCIFALCQWHYGTLSSMSTALQLERRDFWQPPDLSGKLLWVSTIALVFFGPPIYPHAVQRIYAARNEKTLRRSFQLMLLMPLLTTLPVICVALIGVVEIPGLDKQGSEQILLKVLGDLGQNVPLAQPLLLLFLTAALAAIMSTVDSALLALSALFTQDIYARYRPQSSQAHLTFVGKVFSWLLMALLVYLACALPQTLWRLTEIKLEILIQAAPAIFLGLHVAGLRPRPVLAGIVVGLMVAIGLQIVAAVQHDDAYLRPFGIHGGVWGLMANFTTVGLGSWTTRAPRSVTETGPLLS